MVSKEGELLPASTTPPRNNRIGQDGNLYDRQSQRLNQSTPNTDKNLSIHTPSTPVSTPSKTSKSSFGSKFLKSATPKKKSMSSLMKSIKSTPPKPPPVSSRNDKPTGERVAAEDSTSLALLQLFERDDDTPSISSNMESTKPAPLTSCSSSQSLSNINTPGKNKIDMTNSSSSTSGKYSPAKPLPSSGSSEGLSSRSKSLYNLEASSRRNDLSFPPPSARSKTPNVDLSGTIDKKFLQKNNITTTPVKNFDKDIGLRLALPDKIEIMTGKETPRIGVGSVNGGDQEDREDTANSSMSGSRRGSFGNGSFSSSRGGVTPSTAHGKKIILVDGGGSKTPLSSFRKRMSSIRKLSSSDSLTNSTKRIPPPSTAVDDGKEDKTVLTADEDEIILRSSELEPSVHQMAIPSATDLLMYARVCMMMESYDQLLLSQTKQGKKWSDFTDMVGMERFELENIYFNGIGRRQGSSGNLSTMNSWSNSLSPPLMGVHLNNSASGNKMIMSPQPNPAASFQLPPPSSMGNPFGALSPEKSMSLDFGASKSISSPQVGQQQTSAKKEKSIHPSIIKSLLECADDIVVEQYITETIDASDDNKLATVGSNGSDSNVAAGSDKDHTILSGRVQATVFSSYRQRQFIVCYRGSMEQHEKPVKGHVKMKNANGEPSKLHPSNPVAVHPTYRDVYFASQLEKQLFTKLDQLTSDNPFCDVVFTGHSFGGALAVLGAVRYASTYPMMTVSCQTFGSPKVGGLSFRHFANSLPNLRMIKVENGYDPYVDMPEGGKWENVGHVVALDVPTTVMQNHAGSGGNGGDARTRSKSAPSPSSDKTKNRSKSTSTPTKKTIPPKPSTTPPRDNGSNNNTSQSQTPTSSPQLNSKSKTKTPPALAYKFGDKPKTSTGIGPGKKFLSRAASHKSMSNVNNVIDALARSKKVQGKADHEMKSYVHALEQFTHLGLPWVETFVGEVGDGVLGGTGMDREERHVV